jgi:hypothetical protein
MQTLDLRKQYKQLYAPPAKAPQLVDVPEFTFLSIDGGIEPGQGPGSSPGFQEATEAMYGAAYALKFISKQRAINPIDYPVMPLEGLWWIEGGEFDINKKDNWLYRLLIMQPDHVTAEMLGEAVAKLEKKRPGRVLSRLRLDRFHEGLCMQIMHVGPFSAEPATVARLHAFAAENGYRLRNDHHEIYLGDPRKANPETLKTVLRHPVEPVR